MARLDVYAMPGVPSVGFLVDVQSSILDFLETRMVVPLIRAESTSLVFMKDLNPRFDVEVQPHVMLTQAASAVRKRGLRRKVASLEAFHDQITKDLDILFLGF